MSHVRVDRLTIPQTSVGWNCINSMWSLWLAGADNSSDQAWPQWLSGEHQPTNHGLIPPQGMCLGFRLHPQWEEAGGS